MARTGCGPGVRPPTLGCHSPCNLVGNHSRPIGKPEGKHQALLLGDFVQDAQAILQRRLAIGGADAQLAHGGVDQLLSLVEAKRGREHAHEF